MEQKIVLTPDTLYKYFTLANKTNSWYTKDTNTFNFISRNSKNLLVTVGDSWTWGSDISFNNYDDNKRIKNVYGNQLSERLGYDWLNLALCAQGNQWMADRISELNMLVHKLEYNRIVILVVFTGVGRSFNTFQDRHFDYVSYFNNINNFDSFLYDLNKKAVDKILQITKHKNVSVIFSSNAVDPLGFSTNLLPWYQVLGFNCTGKCYTDMTAIDYLQSVPEFLPNDMISNFQNWMIDLIDKTEIRQNMLYSNKNIFRKEHPLGLYHKVWADYLYEEIEWQKL